MAKTELIRLGKNGERIPISIEISPPYRTADGVWRTPVALHGAGGRFPDICGENSFQSLSLAIACIHRRLSSMVERGDRLTLDGVDTDFSMDAYFPKK